MMCPSCPYRPTGEPDLVAHLQIEHAMLRAAAERRARAVLHDKAMNGYGAGVLVSADPIGTRPDLSTTAAPVEFVRRPVAMVRVADLWSSLLTTLETEQAVRWRGARESLNSFYGQAKAEGLRFHVTAASDGSYLAWLTRKPDRVVARKRRP